MVMPRRPRTAEPVPSIAAAQYDGPSRSMQRREALDVLALGKQLSELTDSQLARLPLDEEIREQIAECKRITQHIAHKRQLQFLAKHLRERDLEPLRAALYQEIDARRRGSALHKYLEHWRDKLIAEGDEALGEYLGLHPTSDRQALRQALQKARKTDDPKHLVHARALFRLLRDAQGQPQDGDAAADTVA